MQPLSTANMVLLWRGGKEDGSLSQVDGSKPTDVHKFFFVFENVATSGKSDEERASEFRRYLEGDAFDFFYQAFSRTETSAQMAPTTRRPSRPWSSGLPQLNHLKM